MSREGIDLIEVIHYYLCYRDHIHLSDHSLGMLRVQRNILYYTSRISRMLSRNLIDWDAKLRNRVYFLAYLLCIKYLLDIRIHNLPTLYRKFGVFFSGPIFYYEMYCFAFLGYNFVFLERPVEMYNTGRHIYILRS